MDLTERQQRTKTRALLLAERIKLNSINLSHLLEQADILASIADFKHIEQEGVQRSYQTLQSRCDHLWEQLQSRVASHPTIHNQPKSAPNVHKLKVLAAKEKAYKEEIARQENLQVTDIRAKDPLVIQASLQDEMERTTEQLSETVNVLGAEMELMEQTLSMETELLEERKKINAILSKKLETQNAQTNTVALEKLLRVKEKQLASENHTLMRQLSSFLDTYYSDYDYDEEEEQEFDEEEREIMRKKRQERGSCLSLKLFLQDLMNKLVTAPHFPYVTLDPTKHWDPYVELLIRGGVAEKHPKESRLLKLVSFHE